ncbi:MAG: substrate-binding domain-containing protein [Prevotella sp.]|nr:substrate-binding domain-containing protein [Prevotella sp.]
MLVACCLGCVGEKKYKYVIGVSQCSEDIWREKQNAELRMGAYLNGDVDLRFAAAYDSDERQVQQIDSLVATGIDLLIVAPNQVQTISPAIDRAYDAGVPVIVFERKTNSKKYTAFISADNYEMGRVMGEHVASRLKGSGRVLEVMGLEGSSPAIERHKGFADALQAFPGITLVATLQGDWTEESAYEAATQWLDTKEAAGPVDFVFAQNDRMAMGVRKAAADTSSPALSSTLYCGIDGLPGEGGGIQLVRDSVLDATYIYPTHGDRLLDLAIEILDGKPYEKETRLMSALVTSDNARVLLMQSDETIRQTVYLDKLHKRADNYLQQLSTQRIISLLACSLIILLLLVIVLLYLYHQGKITLRRERVVNNLWNIEPSEATNIAPTSLAEDVVADHTTDSNVSPSGGEEATFGLFITRFKEVVEARLQDSELSVEDLAADMHLSRVQLYRKVKSITGSSPVELLRNARLNRGYQMLLTSDKTVSEVAYAVGFTAPSYFTKCFKEEFGQSPTDIRN